MATMKNLLIAMVGSVLVALGTESTAKATIIYTNPENGHKYFLTDSGSWFDASNQAFFQFGTGTIVKIDDSAEQNWLTNKFSSEGNLWIGLSDRYQEGSWSWEDGTPATYTNWFKNDLEENPNDAFSNEDFAVMNWAESGKWNDILGAGIDPNGLTANFRGIAEIDPLDTPLSGSTAYLVFHQDNGLDSIIPGKWDHMGLSLNGWVYESTPSWVGKGQSYISGDPYFGNVQIEYDSGVQNQWGLDGFIYGRGAKDVDGIEIPTWLGQLMATSINSEFSAGFHELNPFTLSPNQQKGADGAFTCVGLMEWAAEQVSWYNGGQGFIANDKEYIAVPKYFNPFTGQWEWSHFSTITPTMLYWAANDPESFSPEKYALQLLLDPADFLLTDPLGRRLGYTAETGLLNEIPGAFYTGDGWAEQAYLPELVSGDYTLKLFGLDDEANVAYGSSTGGTYFSGFLGKGETRTIVYHVPEPSSVLSLLAVGAFGTVSLLKRKQRQKVLNYNIN